MATPTLVQHIKWVGNGNSEVGNTFQYRLPNQPLSGNFQVLWLQFPSSVSSITIWDNATQGRNIWPNLGSATAPVTDAGNSMKCAVFLLPNGFAGATILTVQFDKPYNGVKAAFQEWNNIALTSPLDGFSSLLNSTTTSVSSGSFNTSVDGDLILQFVGCTDNGSAGLDGHLDGLSQVAKAASYTLSQVDLSDGYFSEYLVQSTHGATNPTATITVTAASYEFPSITIALKSASAGTSPQASQTRVFGVLHSRIIGTGGTGNIAYNWQFPTIGNLLALTVSDPINSIAIVSVSGTSSGSWTTITSSGGNSQACYKASATASTDEMLTVTLNDPTTHLYAQGITYDIVNGGAFDTSVHHDDGTGFGPGNSSASSITPGVSPNIVIDVTGIASGPPDAVVTPSGAVFLCTTYLGQSDLSYMDNGDFHAFNIAYSTTAQNWVFHNTVASSGGYNCLLFSFAGTAYGPIITSQPASTRTVPGGTVTFSVSATASSGALSYQWYRNGTLISGATSASYTFATSYSADVGAGWYCIVTDSNGSITTFTAFVNFIYPVLAKKGLHPADRDDGSQDYKSELTLLRWF